MPNKIPNVQLRAWRDSANMTRAEMAAALNQTPAAQQARLICDDKRIAKWESGEVLWPRPEYRRAAAVRAETRRRARSPGTTWIVCPLRRDKNRAMDERTESQLRVIREVIAVTQAAGIPMWLFGGWGLDARIGRITRVHGDVEFWVERFHADRSKAVLVEAGAAALATQPPVEACEFTWRGVPFSTAYFDRQPDGSSSQPLGRWTDWRFPPGSFGDEPVLLAGTPVLVMSAAGMLAMKEQYPRLRNGRPWRQKDIADIELLRRLTAEMADGRTTG